MIKYLYLQAVLCIPLFTTAQNIGIGTGNPSMKLHVASNTDTSLLLVDNQAVLSVGSSTGIYLKNGNRFTGALKTIGTNSVEARLAFYTYAGTSTSQLRERMSIRDNGYVGIGNILPEDRLHITDSANSILLLQNSKTLAGNVNSEIHFRQGNNYTASIRSIGENSQAARLGFFTNATSSSQHLIERLTIADDGKVGINNTQPAELLDVKGNMNITGQLKVNGDQGQAGQYLAKDAGNNLTWVDKSQYNSFKLFGCASNGTNCNSTFVVPSGITTIFVECWGGGGAGNEYSGGGGGGYAAAKLPVTAGTTINVFVGPGGSNPGVGGGDSRISFSVSGTSYAIGASGGGGGASYLGGGINNLAYGGGIDFPVSASVSAYYFFEGEQGEATETHYEQENATTFVRIYKYGKGGDSPNSPNSGGKGGYKLVGGSTIFSTFNVRPAGDANEPGGGGGGGDVGGSGGNGRVIIWY